MVRGHEDYLFLLHSASGEMREDRRTAALLLTRNTEWLAFASSSSFSSCLRKIQATQDIEEDVTIFIPVKKRSMNAFLLQKDVRTTHRLLLHIVSS